MFGSYFGAGQQATLVLVVLLAAAAMYFHARRRDRAALVLLLASAFVLRLFAALLDPYLNMWDEAVHALVAKNMASDPLKPMLFREEAIAQDITNWTRSHVWLHKQPFFLWVMALSIKILGPTVLAVRLPSVIFATSWVYFIYGIANALHGRNTAFMAALLLTFTQWALTQVGGFEPTDHNDTAFAALVGGSIWAWHVLLPANGRQGVLCIGIFTRCAVLTKWLPGLLVFAGWGAVIMAFGPDRWVRTKVLLRSLLVAILISAPWQIYAWLRFPQEMSMEMTYNARHFSEMVEGQGGTSAFYFERIPDKLYPFEPYLLSVLCLFGLIAIPDKERRVHALVTVVGLFVFFTVAATKMPGYIMPIVPFFMMGIAFCLDRCAPMSLGGHWPTVVRLGAAGFLAAALLDLEKLQLRHTAQCKLDPYFARYVPARTANLAAVHELARVIGVERRTVVFHVPYPENISLAFFHGQEAVTWMPSEGEAQRLRAAGYSIVAVDPPPGSRPLPAYVRVIQGSAPMFLAAE